MAKLLCVCLCLCVQLVVGQFGFFPTRENRGFSQNFNPTRIRNRLQGILHFQPQTPNTNPFGNRPTDEYGRPIYDYGRPNHEYARPGITNNVNPNQNQFGVPHRNDFQGNGADENGFHYPSNHNGFQYPPTQNGFQRPPSQNGFQYPQSQNGFQYPPSQNGFQYPPSQNGFQNPPSQHGFQNSPSQNGFQYPPNQNGFQNPPSVVFPNTPPRNDYPNNNVGFNNPTSPNGSNSPNQNAFNSPSQVGFPDSATQNELNTNGNIFQENIPTNNNANSNAAKEEKENGDTLIAIPGNTEENGGAFTNAEAPREEKQGDDTLIVIHNTSGNAFGDSNIPKEEKQSDNTLIVLPGNSGDAFANSNMPKEDKQSDNTLIMIPGNSEDAFANSNMPKEDKQSDNTLIVIPGNSGNAFANSNMPKENQDSDTLIVIPEKTANEDTSVLESPSSNVSFHDSKETAAPEVIKATEETAKVTKATPAPEYPPLAPVTTVSRNNFNFGPSGIFQETCTTVEGGVGSCIQVTECPLYLEMVKVSRNNPNVLRLLRQAQCGFEGMNPKVCCPRPGIPTDPPTPPPTTTEPTIVMPGKPGEMKEPKDMEPHAAVSLPEPPACGFSNASLSRVVGGIPAKLGDFPWMALLGYKQRRAGAGARWLCGGSLVSPRHVITAAHCIHNRDDLYLVRLGELDISRDDEGATPVDVLIKTRIKHEEYNPKSFTNDIGVLVLSRDIQYTDLIQPICIPRNSELRARSFENYRPFIAGWGDTEFRGPSSPHLQVLQLPVVTNEYCAQAYSAYTAQVIDQRVLCAGFKQGKQDACQGDSGGPLMLPVQSTETRTTHFFQIGVVSYGRKCAEPGFPGVYTRVTNFLPWIEDTVAKN